jgi:cytochrome c-type biogenesis protein
MTRDLGVAFLAGLVSRASACVLPLLPVFVAYMGGVAALPPGESAKPARRFTVAINAVLFVAGFSTAFVALGALAGLVGADLAPYRQPLLLASGVVLVIVGIALLGGVPWLQQERRFQFAHRLPHGPLASYLIGLAFAIGWTPCVGPILAAVLVQAANSATAMRGALLLTAYSAGMGLPFIAAGVFLGPAMSLIRRFRGVYPILNVTAAVVLIGMGLLTLTNRLTVLNSYFPDLGVPQVTAQLSSPSTVSQSPSRLIGKPAPALALASLDGHRTTLAAMRGDPIVITFWATWCVPCRDELPIFAAAYRAHRAQGLQLVAIDFQESPGPVGKFWTELGLEPAPFLDPDGAAARLFGVGLQQTGLPVTVFVGRDGSVRAVLPGQVDKDQFSASLDRLLAS